MKKEYILAAYTVFCWGTLPTITKLVLTSVSNMQVLFLSSLIASICLFLYLIISRKWRLITGLSPKDILELIALGILGNFLYSALYYAALRRLPAADACILNYLWPIIAVICSSFLLHEKLTVRKWIAIAISFCGVVIISAKDTGLQLKDHAGILLCILAAFCYGLFNVLNKKKGINQYLCTAIYFAVTALFSGICFFTTEHYSSMSCSTWMGILWLGIFIDALAILAWGVALQKSEVAFITNFAYATPVIAMIFSFIFLGEPIEIYSILGMGFILTGLFVQCVSKRNNKGN